MKIAFCRYNQNTDLDYGIGSVGTRNTDQRVGVLEALVELGHEVTIVSSVSARHQHALRGESAGKFDNSWMTALRYDLDADIQSYDLLLVETASTNTMFSFTKDGKETRHIGHFANVLREAKGVPVLIWHHGNRDLSFPFSRLSCMLDGMSPEELAKLSPHNYRNLFRNIDIWTGYDYTVWHQSADDERFKQVFGFQYNRPEVSISKFIGTVTGRSLRYDHEYPVKHVGNTDFDLVYVGRAGTNHRIERVKNFYDDPWLDSLIVGWGWDKQTWQNSVTTPGQSQYHGDVQDHYRRGLACVCVLDNELAQVGMTTTRHVQSIMSGCITFADSEVFQAERLVGDSEFVVSSADDVVEILATIADKPKTRQDIVNFQRKNIPLWVDIMPKVLNKARSKE